MVQSFYDSLINSKNIISYITILSIIIFLIYIIIIILINNLQSKNYLKCPINFCATNKYSGEFRCPNSNSIIEYDPLYEVCNDRNGCTNPQTPCVYQDKYNSSSICPGDENYTGLFNDNIPYKNCTNRAICPVWVSVYFIPELIQGDIILTQQTTWVKPSNITTEEKPLSPRYTTGSICGISEDKLNYIWPRTCIIGTLGKNEYDNLWYCMTTDISCPPGQYLFRDINGNFSCISL